MSTNSNKKQNKNVSNDKTNNKKTTPNVKIVDHGPALARLERTVQIMASKQKQAAGPMSVAKNQYVSPNHDTWSAWTTRGDVSHRKGRRRTPKGDVNVMHIKGKELLTAVSGSGTIPEGTRIFQAEMQPLVQGIRLPLEAIIYDMYEQSSAGVSWVPSANVLQTSGQMVMGFSDDPSNPDPSEDVIGTRMINSWDDNKPFRAIDAASLYNRKLKLSRKKYYVHDAAPGEEQDDRLTVSCKFYVQAETDIDLSVGSLGVFYYHYDIILIDANVTSTLIGAGTLVSRGAAEVAGGFAVQPFLHVYEDAVDIGADAAGTTFLGDLSFSKKVGADSLALKSGQYVFTMLVGGTCTAFSVGVTPNNSVCSFRTQPSVVLGSNATFLDSTAYSNVDGVGVSTGVGFFSYATGSATPNAAIPLDMVSGGFAQIGRNAVVPFLAGMPQTGAVGIANGTQFASTTSGAFVVNSDGDVVSFNFPVKSIGTTTTIRSVELYLSRISTDTASVLSQLSRSSSVMAQMYRESTRPYRVAATNDLLISKISKLDYDALPADEQFLCDILCDRRIRTSVNIDIASAFSRLYPVLRELLRSAGIAVGGVILKHATKKFEDYCKKHQR